MSRVVVVGSLNVDLHLLLDPRGVPWQADGQRCQPQLQERLDSQAAWNSSLSGGEQQRLSVARVLLKRPAWVFADEATSALDNAAEAQIYSRLVQLVQGRGGALVSVAHRDSVTEFHTACWLLSPQQGIREAGPLGRC